MGRIQKERLAIWVVGGRAAMSGAASPSEMGRFETRWLAAEKNLSALADLSGRWIDRVNSRRPPRGILLDMDSSVSLTHGEQEKSCWNGQYECTCYHPLFLFNQFGDLERYAGQVSRIYFRGDAGFANSDIYGYLEAEGVKYVIRLLAAFRPCAARRLPSFICTGAFSQRSTYSSTHGQSVCWRTALRSSSQSILSKKARTSRSSTQS
jgi:hypothetical protein